MRLEICGSNESLATGRASKGSLSGVGSIMYGQVTLVGKCFVTLCADKGPFSGVYSQMCSEHTLVSAILIAIWADNRFLRLAFGIAVGPQMDAQMARLFKAFAALLADKGPLYGMHSHMYVQVPVTSKFFIAGSAGKLLLCRV